MKKWAERMLAVCTVLAMVGGFSEIQNTLNESEAVPQVSAYGEYEDTTDGTSIAIGVDVETDIQMIGFYPYVAEIPNTNANLSDGHGIFKFNLDLECHPYVGFHSGDEERIYQTIDFEKYLSVSSKDENIVSVSLLSYDEETHEGEIDVEFHQTGETEITVNLKGGSNYYWNSEHRWEEYYSWWRAENSAKIRIDDYTSTSQLATTTTMTSTTTYTEATTKATTTSDPDMFRETTTTRASSTTYTEATTRETTTTTATTTVATTTVVPDIFDFNPYITGCQKSGVFEVGKNETVDFKLGCNGMYGAFW